MMIIGTAYDILVYQKYLNINNKTTKASEYPKIFYFFQKPIIFILF